MLTLIFCVVGALAVLLLIALGLFPMALLLGLRSALTAKQREQELWQTQRLLDECRQLLHQSSKRQPPTT